MSTPTENKDNRPLREQMADNLKKMVLNNQFRIRELDRVGTQGLKTVYRVVPILLQVNHPDVPGYIEDHEPPRGIYGFHNSVFADKVLTLFPFLRGELSEAVYAPEPAIESLVLMGSSGSVGHTASSDLDYWVCLDRSRFLPDDLKLLDAKLRLITKWAMARYKAEVNFYVVDTTDVAANRIDTQGEETEGEVAPRLLKEEFYRTVVHVAGRLPLWWAVPLGMTYKQYRAVSKHIAQRERLFEEDFIDFGFPQRPDPQEYMAAALWLSRKSETDPFKGVLKLIIIMEQVESELKTPLLCDLVKESAISASKEELPIDPYALTIRRVLDFASRRLKDAWQDLIRISAFFKVRGPLDFSGLRPDSPKARFLKELITAWAWDTDRVSHLNQYSSWSDRERLAMGQNFKNLLFKLYSTTARALVTQYPDQVSVDDRSLAEFKSRMLKRYSEHEAKVEDLPSSFHRKTLPKDMTLYYDQFRWRLYGGRVETVQYDADEADERVIYECTRAARAAAWLVYNGIFDPSLKLRIRPRPGVVGLDTLYGLIERITGLFPPLKARALKADKGWRLGGKGPRLIVINLEEPASETKILSVDMLYRTAWGEMRHVFKPLGHWGTDAEKFLAVADLARATGEIGLGDLHFAVPPGSVGRKMKNNLKVALVQAMGDKPRTRPASVGLKSKLDTD